MKHQPILGEEKRTWLKEELNLSSSNDEPDMVLGTGYFKIKYSPFPVKYYSLQEETEI